MGFGQRFIESRTGSIGRSDESLRASEAAGRKRDSDESISVGFRCAMVKDGRVGKGCVIYSLLVGNGENLSASLAGSTQSYLHTPKKNAQGRGSDCDNGSGHSFS